MIIQKRNILGVCFWFGVILILFVAGCSAPPVSSQKTNFTLDGNRSIIDALSHDSSLVALNSPKFVSVRDANSFMADDELVLAVRVGSVQKIYPLSILLWHEVVNDNISGVPIVVTYCPICGSAEAFNREVVIAGKKKILLFNTSGKVYDSSLLFEDVVANGSNASLFLSFNGEAIFGPHSGLELSYIPSSIGYYRDYVTVYPDSLVLSRETGVSAPYGSDPYTSFYTDSSLLLPVAHVDSRMSLKQVVIGVRIGDVAKAYPLGDLERMGVISDVIAGVDIRIERDETGFVRVVKKATGEVLPTTRAFWFLWVTHNPMTTIYGFQ